MSAEHQLPEKLEALTPQQLADIAAHS
jgi:hypothetical protein